MKKISPRSLTFIGRRFIGKSGRNTPIPCILQPTPSIELCLNLANCSVFSHLLRALSRISPDAIMLTQNREISAEIIHLFDKDGVISDDIRDSGKLDSITNLIDFIEQHELRADATDSCVVIHCDMLGVIGIDDVEGNFSGSNVEIKGEFNEVIINGESEKFSDIESLIKARKRMESLACKKILEWIPLYEEWLLREGFEMTDDFRGRKTELLEAIEEKLKEIS